MLVLEAVEPLSISPHVAIELQYMAIEGYPYEVCGLLYAHNIIVQYPNTFSGDKKLGFDMEVDLKDVDIKAIWHSHPGGLTKPSRDDLPCIQLLTEYGFNFHHIIVTPKSVHEYEAKLVDQATSAA